MKVIHSILKLTALCFLLFPGKAYAQALQYSYDEAGNRISRTLVTVVNYAPRRNEKDGSIISSQNTIRTSACTTHGIIDVKFEDFNPDKSYNISVYTINGIDVTSVIPQSETTTIDISNQQRGVYILSVNIDGEVQTFKITKK